MLTIGICEDDVALRSVLRRALEATGHSVVSTATGAEALKHLPPARPDVIILDLGLPDADGRDVCLALRANGYHQPVLMLTALGGVHHTVAGFEAGADDYLTKPFELEELRVRIESLARQTRRASAQHDGSCQLDAAQHAVKKGSATVRLTPTEYRILGRLMSTQGDVVRRSTLVAAGWPTGAMVSDNTLDSYLRRIRAKLAPLGMDGQIDTVRGVGYLWR